MYLILYIDVHPSVDGFVDYVLAESHVDSNCSGDGLIDVSSEPECFDAAIVIEHTNYRNGSWEVRPRGCLMEHKNIYWNQSPTAKAQLRFRKICKAGKCP